MHRQHAGGQKSYGGVGAALADAIAHLTGAETRVTVLGHLQRGGQPTAGDRLLASAFGVYAVDLVAAGRFDRMVAWQNRRVTDVPLAVAIAMPHCVDPDGALVRTARGLGICLGDG
jgi:6-phosphofructokinase 1